MRRLRGILSQKGTRIERQLARGAVKLPAAFPAGMSVSADTKPTEQLRRQFEELKKELTELKTRQGGGNHRNGGGRACNGNCHGCGTRRHRRADCPSRIGSNFRPGADAEIADVVNVDRHEWKTTRGLLYHCLPRL
eukprot:scaffold407380_cov17-Prasinocladus_malaysianus.AAC.1